MITKEIYMFCDICFVDFCPALNHLKTFEIRKIAKKDNWKYIKGEDICPKCVQKQKEAKGK